MSSYKIKKTVSERKSESQRIKDKYPDRIPIICEKSLMKNSSTIPNLDKTKYLVPKDLTIGQFIWVIRKRLKLEPSEALCLFANGHMMTSSSTMNVVYDNHKDVDGFLYLKYCNENTFG